MRSVGIDPGSKGAIVLLDSDRGTLKAWNLPIITEQRATTTKKVLDAVKFLDILEECGVGEPDCQVHLEDVFSMPTDGHVGAFTFGMNKGALVACIMAMGSEINYVQPRKWKSDMGCTSDKHQTRKVAQGLLPDAKKALTNEGKHEAALIALWGLISSGGAYPTRKVRFAAV